MRVLWVGHNLAYPPVRGVLLRGYNLLREAAKECEIHVLAFDQPAARPPGVSAEDCVAELAKFCASVEFVSLEGESFKAHKYWLAARGLVSRNPYDINWLRSRKMADSVRRLLKCATFDAVHFDTVGLAQYRTLVRAGIGTLLNHHNIESTMMEHRAANEQNPFHRQYWRLEAQKLLRAEQHFCPQFAINLMVSPEDSQILAELVPDLETRVIPNGVDTEYFAPRPDPGGNILLFCGGLDWYPNGEAMGYFFDAIWPRLTRAMPDVRMVVVGRKPAKWLQDIASSDHRVKVTGFVDDVRPYFRQATVYVCPIRLGGGTRLKVLDALAMGMPLVGTSFACSGISIAHEKHALLADTSEAFVDQILRLLADPSLRCELATRGRELVCRNYSWSIVGTKLINAYKDATAIAAGDSQNIIDN